MKSRTAFFRLLAGCGLFTFFFAIHSQAQAPAAPNIAEPTAATTDALSIPELKSKAEAGDAAAQYQLGRSYENGRGVPQNDDKAVLWYRKSADQGYAKAQLALGVMYRLGHGVEEDKAEAVRWFKKAANQRDPAALFNLAVCYYNGDGVGVDDFQAYAYFLLAQEAGSKAAEDGVTRLGAKMTRGETDATYLTIAEMYEKGEVLPKDDVSAAKWCRKAVDDGAPEAAVRMATLYLTGRGVPKDPAKAAELCDAAARHKYAPAERCLGWHYEHGWGVAQDLPRAAKLYRSAADAGDINAMYLLAQMYWHGAGVKQDKTAALEYLLLGGSSGDGKVAQDLANLKLEMTEGEIKSGTKKMRDWFVSHQIAGIALRQQAKKASAPPLSTNH